MARTEKKTKIKGLPPVVRIAEASSLQGTYPRNYREPQTGSIVFKDNGTLSFISGTQIIYGVNVPVSSSFVSYVTEMTGTLTGSGFVVAGVSDTFISYSSPTVNRPFIDSGDFGVDNISTSSVANSFYATGSNIETFEGPLWSKNKVEIDFTPLTASSLSGSQAEWMGYYNFSLKKWEGLGYDIDNSFVVGGAEYDPQGIGFTPSYHPIFASNATPKSNGAKGKPFSNFGFPFDPKFHATPSQLLNVSDYISQPFVVEKIIVQISASYTKGVGTDLFYAPDCLDYDNNELYTGGNYAMCSSSYVINNFFILNQRRGNGVGKNGNGNGENIYMFDTSGENLVFLQPSSNTTKGTIRDLVTWFEIASFNNDYENVYTASLYPNLFYRDYTFVNASSTDAFSGSWTGNIVMSASVRSPNFTPLEGTPYSSIMGDTGVTLITYPTAWLGSRAGLAGVKATGRDMKNPIGKFSGEIEGTQLIGGSPTSWSRENPYILMPGDKLIFGWQIPAPDYAYPWNINLTSVTASVAHFPVAPAKIILYGSYLAEGKADNSESFVQILSSDNIHEAIK